MSDVYDGRKDAQPAAELRARPAPDAAGERRPSPLVFQYRVLKALVMREISARHGDSRMGPLMGVVMPVISLSAMIMMFGLRGKMVPSDFSLGVFVITGYPLWQGFQGIYSRAMNAAARADPLLMFPQITQLDLILSMVIVEFAMNSVVFFVLCLGVMMFFHSGPPADPMGVILCYWGCMWIGAALGMILCAVQRAAPMVVVFINTFLRFGMWVSGVVFSINRLPQAIWPYLQWNPILHLVEGARTLWNPNFQAPIFDPGYVIAIGFVLTTAGFVLERITRRLVGP